MMSPSGTSVLQGREDVSLVAEAGIVIAVTVASGVAERLPCRSAAGHDMGVIRTVDDRPDDQMRGGIKSRHDGAGGEGDALRRNLEIRQCQIELDRCVPRDELRMASGTLGNGFRLRDGWWNRNARHCSTGCWPRGASGRCSRFRPLRFCGTKRTCFPIGKARADLLDLYADRLAVLDLNDAAKRARAKARAMLHPSVSAPPSRPGILPHGGIGALAHVDESNEKLRKLGMSQSLVSVDTKKSQPSNPGCDVSQTSARRGRQGGRGRQSCTA